MRTAEVVCAFDHCQIVYTGGCLRSDIQRFVPNREGEPTHTLVPCWMTTTLPPKNQCTICFCHNRVKSAPICNVQVTSLGERKSQWVWLWLRPKSLQHGIELNHMPSENKPYPSTLTTSMLMSPSYVKERSNINAHMPIIKPSLSANTKVEIP